MAGGWRLAVRAGLAGHSARSRTGPVIGGILEHAGVTGFLGNREQFEASGDDGRDAELTFVETWWRMYEDMPKANMDLAYPSPACGDFFGIEGKPTAGSAPASGRSSARCVTA